MVLGDAENCTGDPARRAGNEFVYQMQAQQNIEMLNGIGVKRIVVTCPHCLNSLGREYPQLNGHYEVIHHTELLSLLISENRLTIPPSNSDTKVTYHDPCYLGRHNRVFTPPRDLIAALGADFVEMPRNSERSFCCGAGGGRMWMEEKLGTRINNERATEAIATGAEAIAVGCPFCNVMIGDAVNAQATENSPVVEDVALMLLDRVKQS
jgi:Fe-S oxidoreductase